jgi:rod shape-determining protein MreB
MSDAPPDWARGRADLAIDLGTATTTVVNRSGGMVFEQSTLCCFEGDAETDLHLFAAGDAAKRVEGREVRSLRTVRPLRHGVLADVRATCEMLSFAIGPFRPRRRMRRSRVIIGIPVDATQAERRALARAAHDAGLAEPLLLFEPMLAAIGSGLDVAEARGRMIVDCGAGTTDVVVLSLGGICSSKSVRGGGDSIDLALRHHLHARHQFEIGAASAETLKMALCDALASGSDTHVEVPGLDTRSGLPRILATTVAELRPIIERYADEIAIAVRAAFAETAPDLASGILEDGITLSGGASLTTMIAERIEASTGIPAKLASDPRRAVARGLATILQ